MQTLDNIVLFDDKVTNTTKLFTEDDQSTDKKPGFLRNAISRVQATLAPIPFISAAVNKTSRIKNFFLFSILAFILFIFSLSCLPMILIFPEKFALVFSLASLVMHVALSYLKPSTEEYIQALVSNKDYTTVSTLYFVSMFFTIYSSIYLGSYIVVLAACGMQMFTISWYLFTMFPRGSQGVLTFLKYSFKICSCGKSILPI